MCRLVPQQQLLMQTKSGTGLRQGQGEPALLLPPLHFGQKPLEAVWCAVVISEHKKDMVARAAQYEGGYLSLDRGVGQDRPTWGG